MDDKNKVLLALNLTEPAVQTKCPSDEKLAALADRRLDKKEKDELLKHLNSCSKCYRQWLEILSDQQVKTSHKLSRQGIFKASGITVAAMCLAFLLFTTALHQPEMGGLLDSSYKTAFNNQLSLKGLEKDKLPVLPWESEIKRSLPYKAGSDASKAFTSGFISGRKELKSGLKNNLSDAGKWDNTEWAPCFFLGRWCVLLQSVCRSEQDIPVSFWKQQQDILDRMNKLFLEQDPTDIIFELEIVEKALRQIKTHLKAELSGKYDPKSTCRRLEPELEAIKASMS